MHLHEMIDVDGRIISTIWLFIKRLPTLYEHIFLPKKKYNEEELPL